MSPVLLQRLRRAAGRVRNQLGPRAAILLYHRVTDALPSDPYLLRVTPRHFTEHLEVIRKVGRPMSLRDFVSARRAGRQPHRAVVVTFDDGYADNLYEAKPLLERHGIPATVFMTAGEVGRVREFWWDELQRLVLRPGELPGTLRLGGQAWELGAGATFGEADDRRHADWHLERADDPTPRHRLLRELYGLLRPIPDAGRARLLDELAAWAGDVPAVRPTHRAMGPRETAELANGGLIEVGAHTLTHPSLPSHPFDVQREEVCGSRRQLEEVVGAPVTSFAYPYGDHTAETVEAVRGAGFECACACFGRVTTPREDMFRLPRLDVFDWDGDTFARHLERWFRG